MPLWWMEHGGEWLSKKQVNTQATALDKAFRKGGVSIPPNVLDHLIVAIQLAVTEIRRNDPMVQKIDGAITLTKNMITGLKSRQGEDDQMAMEMGALLKWANISKAYHGIENMAGSSGDICDE
ncbi:hypothetical protein EWM64_g4648 [Hericium alpestre]|uniref:Uncharacterized protein n=1 Tax=Hericium alpestre TaxID=135208 RepID=A0A4Y9ZX22_9AGAM|nr:hypothetical protein EWM64_g4648 [Hericium alpestre]